MCRAAGASKVRLTGGEPTLRRGLDICSSIKRDNPGVKSLGLTTNSMKLLSRSDGETSGCAGWIRRGLGQYFTGLARRRCFLDDAAASIDPQTGPGRH